MTAVDPAVRELAHAGELRDPQRSILRSGQPMTHVMWVDADDDHVLLNTEVHRAKFKAIERDPRVTVTIWKRDDPYTYAEVRGRVVETVRGRRGARTHRRTLTEVPGTGTTTRQRITSERVLLRVAPDVAADPLKPDGSSAPPGLRARAARASCGRAASAAAP